MPVHNVLCTLRHVTKHVTIFSCILWDEASIIELI
jgi:hypothetical protein